jgi:multicomponent Na+:H+ antiporter subunit C
MIVGFVIFDMGIHLIIISIGYIQNGTAPIIENVTATGRVFVDPVPQAMVLTSIVIGLGVTALMLVFAVNMHKKRGTLDIEKFEDLKW